MSEPTKVKNVTIQTEKGGDLEVSKDNPMDTPGGLQLTDYGAAFGPLEIISYPNSRSRVAGLNYKETSAGIFDSLFGSDSGGGLFATLPIAALTGGVGACETKDDEEELKLSRRDAIRGMVAIGGISGMTYAAKAATATKTRASFGVERNPSGIRVRVLDRVENVLPSDRTYYTYINNKQYSRLSVANEGSYGDILPGMTGTAVVGPKGAAGGFISRILSSKTQIYDNLPLEKPIGEAKKGAKLTITSNDILVEHMQKAGSSQATLHINGVSIPHANEDNSSERGYYEVHNGELVYNVGQNAPSGQSATLTLYASTIDEVTDDVERSVL